VTKRGVGVGQLHSLGPYEQILGDRRYGVYVAEQPNEPLTLQHPAGQPERLGLRTTKRPPRQIGWNRSSRTHEGSLPEIGVSRP
jgi:hypothetical protein